MTSSFKMVPATRRYTMSRVTFTPRRFFEKGSKFACVARATFRELCRRRERYGERLRARRPSPNSTISPIDEPSVMMSPTQPGRPASAPKSMKMRVAIACQTTWCIASSAVSHDPKKLGMNKAGTRRTGTKALAVKTAPMRLAPRNNQEIVGARETSHAFRDADGTAAVADSRVRGRRASSASPR